MKKFLCMLICAVFVVSLFGVVGCKPKDTRTELRIISWNMGTEAQNNLNRKMIKEFEAKYPDYRVTIEDPGAVYTDTVQALAGKQDLPDVIMLDNLPTALSNRYIMEISDMVAADADWQKVPEPLREACQYNGRTFAVPAEMHMWGIYINETVFENANLDPLDVNPTVEDFKAAVTALNKPGEGISSYNDELEMLNWFPAALDENVGYYTWDGEKFNLDGDAFANTLAYMKEIRTGKLTFAAWDNATREATGYLSVDDLWYNNGLAMYYNSSASRSALKYGSEGNEVKLQGKMKFIGLPGGRNVMVPDLWGISAGTEHPEMAYELAKWMSFSSEGTLKRLELDAASMANGGKQEFVSLPITSDKAVLDAYFDNEETAGLREVYESLSKGVVEPVKTVPGYTSCRWTLNTGLTYNYTDNSGETPVQSTRTNATLEQVYDDIWKSTAALEWADYKAEINTKVNKALENASRALDRDYPAKTNA